MSVEESLVRIATWNLARPTQNASTKNQNRLEKIREINADVWILTETNSAICLEPSHAAIESCPIPTYHKAGEHLSTIWSRWTIRRSIATFDSSYAVCAEVESPFGLMLVYGTVIPYANEKGADGTSKKWVEHRHSIRLHNQDWLRLHQNYPDHLICIAGDFNQNRDGTVWYNDQESVELLTQALQDCSVECFTEADMRAKGLSRASVDHICLSKSLKPYIVAVKPWEGTTAAGGKMSDHNGVVAELKLN